MDLAVIPCLVIRHTTKEELSKDGPSLVGILGWRGVTCLPRERGPPQEYEDIPLNSGRTREYIEISESST